MRNYPIERRGSVKAAMHLIRFSSFQDIIEKSIVNETFFLQNLPYFVNFIFAVTIPVFVKAELPGKYFQFAQNREYDAICRRRNPIRSFFFFENLELPEAFRE